MSEFFAPELRALGLTPFFLQQWVASQSAGSIARIVRERRGEYEVLAADAAHRVSLSGRLEHELPDDDRPTVGDWVLFEPADPVGRIERVLDRQSVLRRAGVDGTSRAQNLAANVDLCCVVAALSDGDLHARRRALNPRRIQRYLITAANSHIPALVLVNKADALPSGEAEQALAELSEALPSARCLLTSARSGQGLPALVQELGPGVTAVLLGSSGVGKSTLVNALLGHEAQRTSAERAHDTRGRHTTTERQLLALQGGGLLIDTPGMRELALWADAESDPGVGEAFDDIERFAAQCRFRDCGHHDEPGCAVQAGIETGALSADRLEQARKLERELLHQRARVDVRLRQARHQERKAQTRAGRLRARDKRHG